MPDFREIAANAKAAHDAKVAEQQRKQAAEQDARSRFVDAGIAALEAHVVPLLDKAAAAFAEDGIEAKIERFFDVKNRAATVLPSISFRCLGPKRASDGWRFDAPPVFYSSDGDNIHVGAGRNGFDKEPKQDMGKSRLHESEALVAKGVEQAIKAYYEELARAPYH